MRLKRFTLKQVKIDPKALLTCLIGMFMIWELARVIHVPGAGPITWWIQIAELITLGAVLGKIRYCENIWIITLMLGLILIFLTSAIRPETVLEDTKPTLMRGVFIYLLCPSIGILLTEKNIRRFLTWFILVWVAFYTAMSAIGIYSMYTGRAIMDFSGIYGIYNEDGHLNLIAYYTVTAANLTVAILMAVIGIALTNKKTIRIVYTVGILIMQYALALTTGRAGMLSTGIGAGIAVAAAAETKLRGKMPIRWKRILVLGGVIVLCTVGIYQVFVIEQNVFNRQVSGQQTALFIHAAKAEEATNETAEEPTEEPAIQTLSTRSLGTTGLSGRGHVYQRALDLIRKRPYLLLTGTSVPLVTEYINKDDQPVFEHVHCMPLQILLETGIGGLILLVLFLIPFIRSAWRLFFAIREPAWKRLIFIPTLCMFFIELVECILRLDKGFQVAVPVFLFYGLTISLAKTIPAPEKKGKKEITV